MKSIFESVSMKLACVWLLLSLLSPISRMECAELVLTSPLDYQVIQRATPNQGALRIVGELSEDVSKDAVVEVRVLHAGNEVAKAAVEHVGIGEVFVIAGQSNSANHGQERLIPQSGRIAAFDGTKWQIANDPQPGASGKNGSFIPAFGDLIVEKLDVPVGIVACGIGSTSVREWLPRGSKFPNPPTVVTRVEELPSGEWSSKGEAFDAFVKRMKPLGQQGFLAVLWHQGVRLLKAETVREMSRDQLPAAAFPININGLKRDGVSFGLGFSVVVEKFPGFEYVPQGEYGWGGAASTHFWISPKDELAVVVLSQIRPFTFQCESAVKPIIYEAIR